MPPAPHYANAVRLRKVHCPILFGPALRKNCLRLFFTVRPQSGFTELTKRAHSPARRPAPTHLPLFDGRLIAQSYRIVHCPYPINLRDRAQSARCKTRFIRRSRCGAHSSDRGPILACYSSSIALFFFFRFLRCISPLLLLIGILSLSLAALAPKTNRRRSPPNPSDPPPPFPSSFKRSKTREALPPLQPSFQPPSTPSVRPFRDSSAVPPPAPVSPPPPLPPTLNSAPASPPCSRAVHSPRYGFSITLTSALSPATSLRPFLLTCAFLKRSLFFFGAFGRPNGHK